MTIGKDVSLNHDLVADGALDRKTASVNGGLYPLDNNASQSSVRVHTASFPGIL
jgi:shikimate kinase